MPEPLNVDWPAVRVLAVAVGVREAAGQMSARTRFDNARNVKVGWLPVKRPLNVRPQILYPFFSGGKRRRGLSIRC